jgi:hypothetical protein
LRQESLGEKEVVEYDLRGKGVWEVSIEQPVAAVRPTPAP